VDWHVGFACAGVGMTLGLVQYVAGRKRLRSAIDRLEQNRANTPLVVAAAADPTAGSGLRFTASEWRRMGAIVILFLAASVFWGGYEQAGSTLNLFADRYTRLDVLGFSFPSSWFQSVPPLFVIVLAPAFAWLWMGLGRREPSVPAKFAIALVFMGLAFLVLVPAGGMAQSGANVRVSPLWLIACYGISELGELCLSPVGLSAVTKLAPIRIVGLMMGVWFLSNSAGNKLAGWAAGFFSTVPLQTLFGIVAAVLFATSLVMFVLVKPIRRLMGDN
jgi:POT family proton-dependent oligopeptide transporter